MASMYRECGYATSMIGKWQLGFFKEAYLPWNRGFDDFFGQLLGGQDYYSRRKCLKLRNHGNLCGYDLRTHEGPVRDTSGKYQPFLYADKAKEKFMKHDKSKPLFMYIAFQSVHRPLQAPSKYTSIYENHDLTASEKVVIHLLEIILTYINLRFSRVWLPRWIQQSVTLCVVFRRQACGTIHCFSFRTITAAKEELVIVVERMMFIKEVLLAMVFLPAHFCPKLHKALL